MPNTATVSAAAHEYIISTLDPMMPICHIITIIQPDPEAVVQ
jgi:hypothetical protein